MKLAARLSSFALVLSFVLADDVRFDNTYDNADGQLTTVSCSTGANGLVTRGFTTFGSLPSFPNIGATAAVEGFNSVNYGSCWQLAFSGASIFLTAIDHAGDGFNIAEAAMNTLTNGQAEQLGVVQASATMVDASNCGL
ncbi:Cerato-platanin [Amylostereum chailletii]|nr:Cerato-platanin [Amylostereum chailletii]